MPINADLPVEMKAQWQHVKSFVEIGSERTVNGETNYDARWYLSSLPIDPEKIAIIIRRHWEIENQLHWVLDVVFREDTLTISNSIGATHIALVNRVALSLLKKNKLKGQYRK